MLVPHLEENSFTEVHYFDQFYMINDLGSEISAGTLEYTFSTLYFFFCLIWVILNDCFVQHKSVYMQHYGIYICYAQSTKLPIS